MSDAKPHDRVARGMARGAQGASGKGKGIHAAARPAERRAARDAVGEGGQGLRVRAAGGQGDARRPLRRPTPADRVPLHVRPGVGGGVPELLLPGRPYRRRRRAPRAARRDAAGGVAGAPPPDRGVQSAWAGASRGCHRMGPTSTSTITCRSRKTRWRTARCTTISNRANSRARRPPASASSTRTSTVRCSTRIRVTRADSTCWSARTTTSTSRRRAATKTAWPSRWRGCATTIGTEAMKLFYGWIIVGVGIVVTCVGFGAMASLTVFLQPMATSMGWSRTGISTAALINWLCMGVGALVWGALSDRFGTRAVVLSGGVLLGLGLVTASQAASLGQFQLVFGMIVGLAAGSFYTPMTATTTRWFTR